MKYLILFIFFFGCFQERTDPYFEQIKNLKEDYNNLIKERGLSFHEVTTAPDSLYLVSFGDDTIWYYREQKTDTIYFSMTFFSRSCQ